MSVLQYYNSIRYRSLSVMLKTLFNQLKMSSRIVGQPLDKLNDLLRLADNIVSDPNHVLHNELELLHQTGGTGSQDLTKLC